jgi:hypothetical protein
MSTQAEKSPAKNQDATPSVPNEFAMYPLYKVVSIFEDSDKVDAAIKELTEHGFKKEDIETYCGVEGKKNLHFHGSRKGKLASLIRTIQHLGPERTYLDRYEKHLSDGRCMIAVSVDNKERKETAARLLHHHTNERVTYFGLLTADEIK